MSKGRTGRGDPTRQSPAVAGEKPAGDRRTASPGDGDDPAGADGAAGGGAVRRGAGAGGAGGGLPGGIAREITAEGGMVTFARFMELALTHPTDGYYSRPGTLLGPRGHFTTAPCLSPEFNRAVARLLEELITAAAAPAWAPGSEATSPNPAAPSPAPPVVAMELGGGTGELAATVIENWEKERPGLRELVAYVIVEMGETLQAEQKRRLAPVIERGWQVRWARTIDEGLRQAAVSAASPARPVKPPTVSGASPGPSLRPQPLVVVSNEFFDALSVHLVDVRGAEPREAWVELDDLGGPAGGHAPREVWGALSPGTEAELETLFRTVTPTELRAHSRDGIIELRPSAGALLQRLAAHAAGCCVLTIDYGGWFGGGQGSSDDIRVAPAQYRRTLRGYFRHQPATDPYVRVGRQDLTADVDFRALDLHGRRAGFETVLLTTVAGLLRANHDDDRLERLRARAQASLEADRRASILAKLLDEDDLGGAFKVMLQVKE